VRTLAEAEAAVAHLQRFPLIGFDTEVRKRAERREMNKERGERSEQREK
jgi:hypothetical protein